MTIARVTACYRATQSGEDGLAAGAWLADAVGAALDVVSVVGVPSSTAPRRAGLDRAIFEQASSALELAAAKHPGSQHRVLHADSFVETLVADANSHRADVMALGLTGDGAVLRNALGSLASALIRQSHLPILAAPRGFADLPHGRPIRITLALDAPDAALPHVYALAVQAGLAVRLVSLVGIGEPDLAGPAGREARARHIAAAHQNLATAQATLPPGLSVDSVVAEGDSLTRAYTSLRWDDGDIAAFDASTVTPPRVPLTGSRLATIARLTQVPLLIIPAPRVR